MAEGKSMLSDSEKENLHLALLAYLEVQGFNKTKNALREQTKVTKKTEKAHRKIIPENWRAIVRLRRKITSLEEKNKQLKLDIKNFGVVKLDADPLPKKPPLHNFEKHKNVITCVKFHPKYPSLASASEDSSIVIWNGDSGAIETELRGHQDAVNYVAFNPKGNQLCSCSADMSIKFWDLEEAKCTKSITGHDHNVSCVVYTLCGKYLLSCSRDKTIRKWDVATGAQKAKLEGHKEWVRFLSVAPNKKELASCGSDKMIKIWNLKSGECVNTFSDAHDDVIECLAYSSLAADEIIIKHLLKGDAQKAEQKAFKERAAAAKAEAEEKKNATGKDPGGAFLLSGSRDKSIKLWSLLSGTVVLELGSAHDNWVRGLLFDPTGKYFVSCSDDKSIKVWNIQGGGKLEVKLDSAHELFVTSIDWCNSMDLMASGGVDNKVKVWSCTP